MCKIEELTFIEYSNILKPQSYFNYLNCDIHYIPRKNMLSKWNEAIALLPNGKIFKFISESPNEDYSHIIFMAHVYKTLSNLLNIAYIENAEIREFRTSWEEALKKAIARKDTYTIKIAREIINDITC